MTTPQAAKGIGQVVGQTAAPSTYQGSVLAASATAIPISSAVSSSLLSGLSSASIPILQYMYRQRQAAIGRAASQAISSLWIRHIIPDRMADSWGNLRNTIMQVIQQFYDAAAADSAQFYEQMRVLSDMGHIHIPMSQLPRQELISVADSTSIGEFFRQIKLVDEPQAAEIAGRSLTGAGARLSLKGGRQTIVQAVHSDPQATGWERLISARSCSFCSMLASRGAVYRSHRQADFRAHDHCTCTAQPLFRGQEPSQQSRDLATQWQRVTAGKSGAGAREAWQQYWEAKHEPVDTGAAAKAEEGGPGNAPEQHQQIG